MSMSLRSDDEFYLANDFIVCDLNAKWNGAGKAYRAGTIRETNTQLILRAITSGSA